MKPLRRSARERLFTAVGTLGYEIAVAEDHLGSRRAGGGLRCPRPASLPGAARPARHDIGLEGVDPERRSALLGRCGRQERAVAALEAPDMAGEGGLIARGAGGELAVGAALAAPFDPYRLEDLGRRVLQTDRRLGAVATAQGTVEAQPPRLRGAQLDGEGIVWLEDPFFTRPTIDPNHLVGVGTRSHPVDEHGAVVDPAWLDGVPEDEAADACIVRRRPVPSGVKVRSRLGSRARCGGNGGDREGESEKGAVH